MNHPNNLLQQCLRMAVFGVALLAQTASAATSCAFTAVSPVVFGTYNVLESFANNDGVGSLSIRCKGGGTIFVVKLSTGQSNTYSPRLMLSGGNGLNYNLYTSASRSVVWGDGSGGSSTLSVGKNSSSTLFIFGQIPANQDAAIGFYTDTLVASIEF